MHKMQNEIHKGFKTKMLFLQTSVCVGIDIFGSWVQSPIFLVLDVVVNILSETIRSSYRSFQSFFI